MSETKKKEDTIESLSNDENLDESAIQIQPKTTLEKIIGANSPSKSLEAYQGHALNYDGEISTSRIIRGTEGLLGNMDKAVVDVIVGLLQKASKAWEKFNEGRSEN